MRELRKRRQEEGYCLNTVPNELLMHTNRHDTEIILLFDLNPNF